jgi:hypothetical protein
MRTIFAVTSIVFLGIAGPVLAQSNMGTDYTGRFDGTPPLGTSPESPTTNGLVIPLDPVETGSVDVVIPRNTGPTDVRRARNRTTAGAASRYANFYLAGMHFVLGETTNFREALPQCYLGYSSTPRSFPGTAENCA